MIRTSIAMACAIYFLPMPISPAAASTKALIDKKSANKSARLKPHIFGVAAPYLFQFHTTHALRHADWHDAHNR
ncbi:hypothetical protein [Caballeronia sp. LZ034LL]|uniref:hypothetical protein n=1 Tax=Caballeronia sp. LZ034LL TaxID=3038567 RepID=UPI00285858A4|nr:hypothetical protein [Caballeronia sp. LZ034LL]MDR5837519.1 hypothetical protein [Caballeronia sp. LZ034LL]